MPATEFHRASASRPSFGRSLLSIGREQANSMDSEATSLDNELEAFQKQVAERFSDLSNAESDELLSIQWIKKLLDVFLCCQEEFRAIIFNNQGLLNKSPLDRYVSEFFERSVKALDVCNAIRDGIEQIRQWKKQLEIVLCAFHSQRTLGEGHFRRAKKALIDLVVSMLDEKDSGTSQAQRNRSFGRTNPNKSLANSRSLSWSVSRSWSAAKQLQAIGNNLVAPKTNEVIASNGLVIAVFTMNYVLLFVMWALVAAIPCQDRGLQTHFYITRQYIWASHILSLHDRIIEESKKRDKRNSCGLLKEINEVEKCVKMMNVVMDCVEFPLSEEKEEEVRQSVKELGMAYEAIKDNLDPLEKQVREVFHRIVRSRTDGLDSIGRTNNQD